MVKSAISLSYFSMPFRWTLERKSMQCGKAIVREAYPFQMEKVKIKTELRMVTDFLRNRLRVSLL